MICYFKLKKTAKVNDVDLTWDMISLEDAVINVAINNPSEILTVEKQATNFNFHELQNFDLQRDRRKYCCTQCPVFDPFLVHCLIFY